MTGYTWTDSGYLIIIWHEFLVLLPISCKKGVKVPRI